MRSGRFPDMAYSFSIATWLVCTYSFIRTRVIVRTAEDRFNWRMSVKDFAVLYTVLRSYQFINHAQRPRLQIQRSCHSFPCLSGEGEGVRIITKD